MKLPVSAITILLCASATMAFGDTTKNSEPAVDADGTVHMPALSVPLSRYMSEEAKRKFIAESTRRPKENSDSKPSISQQRADVDDFYRPMVERAKTRYSVSIEEGKTGGVSTQLIVPKEGVSARNRERALINLHGGGFVVGAGLGGLAESIPIAGVGKFRVISVDYRMAPEHHFPAASQDVAAVYSELLKKYRPENIGIYGCSAGGILSAMAAAWFQKQKLPAPGALGIFSAGAYGRFAGSPADPNTWGGDSYFTGPPLVGQRSLSAESVSGALNYTADTDLLDPLVSPALSGSVLAQFPPTLLITGTRAFDMSAAVQTQRELSKAGREADLHLWDGMGHCFFFDAELPESQEAYAVIAKFFDTHLGRDPK